MTMVTLIISGDRLGPQSTENDRLIPSNWIERLSHFFESGKYQEPFIDDDNGILYEY